VTLKSELVVVNLQKYGSVTVCAQQL